MKREDYAELVSYESALLYTDNEIYKYETLKLKEQAYLRTTDAIDHIIKVYEYKKAEILKNIQKIKGENK